MADIANGMGSRLSVTEWLFLNTDLTLHIHRRLGKNTHHMLEASFKGVARSLRDAVRIEGGGIPSTKGSL